MYIRTQEVGVPVLAKEIYTPTPKAGKESGCFDVSNGDSNEARGVPVVVKLAQLSWRDC